MRVSKEQDTKATMAILMTNVFGGGTVRHAIEMAKAWSRQGVRVVFVTTTGRLIEISVFQDVNVAKEYRLWDDAKGEKILFFLRAYNVQLLHVEHLLDAEPLFLTLHRKLAVPLVVTLHDYYTMCPFIKLTNEQDEYCGEEGIAACRACLGRRHFYSPTTRGRVSDISQWRKLWEEYLQEASVVIVPSEDMKQRVLSYFPHIYIRMVENPELRRGRHGVRRVGLIGGLGAAKGARKIRDVLRHCAMHSCQIHFVLFGSLMDVTLTKEEKKHIIILGAYQGNEIYDQIRKHPVDFFWFPSVWPETYSYTLSISVAMGIPSVSTDLGAIASRIRQHGWGDVYPWKAVASEIVRKLETFDYQSYGNPRFCIGNTSFGNVEDYYGDILPMCDISGDDSLILSGKPVADVYAQIHDTLGRAEFYALWERAKFPQRMHLLRYVDRDWLMDVFREKGCRYILRKIYEKTFRK